ncbi:MAG TPA: CPBP family intramembrane glutamic endopeptidase, partial [Isosphaeraceae bacterium]|nr:CPBP family intramembrane glutamic endopeptidase [Isosphaeraceae bacterium]
MLMIDPHNPWFLGYWAVLAMTAAGSLSAWVWAANQVASGSRPFWTLLDIPSHRLVPWGAGSLGAVVLVYLAIQSGSYLGFLEFRARGLVPGPALATDEPLRASDQLVLMTGINIQALILIPWLLYFLCGARPRDFGLENRQQVFRDAQTGFLAFLLATPVIYLAFFLAQLLWSPENHFIFESLKQGLDPLLAVLAIVSAVVTAPASEELFFRGLLLGWLVRAGSQPRGARPPLTEDQERFSQSDRSRRLSAWVANVLTSLVFASLHAAQWPAPVPLFVLSLVLGWLYLRSGRLVAPWALHTAFNALSTICMLLQVQAGALPRDAAAPQPADSSVKTGHLTPTFHNLRSPQQANRRVDVRDHQGSGTGDAIPGR